MVAMSGIFKRVIAIFALVGMELLLMWLIAIACAVIFLTMYQVAFSNQQNELDVAAFQFAENIATDKFTSVMRFVTFFASKNFLIYGSLSLAFIFYFFKRHRWYALKVPVIAAGSTILNQSLKSWFNRPRPETALIEQSGLSFPSGHAMIGGAFYGLLIYLVWTSVSSEVWRWIISGLLFLWVLLIGFSRIYLHVHYATDVLAGWAAGFIFLIISLLLLKKLELKYAKKAEEIIKEDDVVEINK